jgi:hypothetical protein
LTKVLTRVETRAKINLEVQNNQRAKKMIGTKYTLNRAVITIRCIVQHLNKDSKIEGEGCFVSMDAAIEHYKNNPQDINSETIISFLHTLKAYGRSSPDGPIKIGLSKLH